MHAFNYILIKFLLDGKARRNNTLKNILNLNLNLTNQANGNKQNDIAPFGEIKILSALDSRLYGFILRMYFYADKKSGKNTHQFIKYNILKQNNANFFLNDRYKDHYLAIFSLAQRIYFFFNKAARRFKVRKARNYAATTDMYFNPLNELPAAILLPIYDDKPRMNYIFRISDIISIVNNALIHNFEFFVSPEKIKNPYTNLPFTVAQLYYIYFQIKRSPFIMPMLFHQLFLCRFNLNKFSIRHEIILRNEAIRSCLINMDDNMKLHYIIDMIYDYKILLPNINIDPEFPKKTLIKNFEQFLCDYLYEKYSLAPALKYHHVLRLTTKLFNFNYNNPCYGRKIMKAKKQRINCAVPATFSFGRATIAPAPASY